jgi:class 3 adenylate cyclase
MPIPNGFTPFFRAIQTRLEIKILLLIVAVLLLGFGSYVILTIQKESEVMLQQHHEKLELYGETLTAGIRNVMLTGKAPLASEFVNDARHTLRYGWVTIYDRFGREVFLREWEGMIPNVKASDPILARTLESRQSQWTMLKDRDEEVLNRYEPIRNSRECWRCHDPKEDLRGVLQVALKPGTIRASGRIEAAKEIASIMGETIATAFRTIMLGGQGEMMDTLTTKARSMPAVERVQVYSRLGYLAFGPEEPEMQEEKILGILKTHNRDRQYYFEQAGAYLRLYIPLENRDRCQVCHGSNFPIRGMMVVDFRMKELLSFAAAPVREFTQALQWTVYEGFKSIMLVGRATSARYYIDELRSLPAFHTLRVYDLEGNERFLNPPPRKRDEVLTAVREKKVIEFSQVVDGEEFMVRLSPLPNEVRCYSCHGKKHDVRGVVEVTASMEHINKTIMANKLRSVGVGFITLVLVWGVIRLFMKSVVVKPVKIIEGVASRVGEGDFTARAEVKSQDEIGNLARRMNEMVQGLRERLHLQKFVSRQTIEAVQKADLHGVKLGGERKLATVFFSDIRGFTAFSEKTEPEKVVTMLNHCLSTQTDIVRRYGGDIDKYVGDELVAVFEGESMVENAVRAALEIQALVFRAGDGEDVISIGIGINTGEMVMGAMGSEQRMDFTVIGDHVNLGARLCSAAKANQILLSEFAVRHLPNLPDIELIQLDPMVVKGKQAPIQVFEVQWRNRTLQRHVLFNRVTES